MRFIGLFGAAEPGSSKHFFLFFFATWSRHSHTGGTFERDWGFYINPRCETDSCLHESRLTTVSWLHCNSLMCLRRECCPKRVHVYMWLTTDTRCCMHRVSVVSSQLWKYQTNAHIVMVIHSRYEWRRRRAGDSRHRGDPAWSVEYKHPVQNALHISARHTLTMTHTEVMVLAWGLHLTQLYCPCVPSLAERVVCACVEVLCEQLGPKTPGSRAPSSNISWLALKSPVLGKHRP